MEFITLTIDQIRVQVPAGSTVLQAAAAANIAIPTLCHDDRVEAYGACGLCVVEAAGNPKLLRACSTKAADGMVIVTRSPRIDASRKFALELLLSDHTGDCIAPCQLACPAGTDCQAYVGLLANGDAREAARIIGEKLPFASSIGRVCPHPCEDACRRKHVEEPVSIAALKSYAGDWTLANNAYIPPVLPATGKSVAVIGGGPGGLSAAYFLRQKGHAVTVYEQMPHMGGMLRYGIPAYRLPKDILQAEIDRIAALGVTFVNNTRIGETVTLAGLQAEHDAVVVAVGAWTSSKMRIEGEALAGVYGGIDMLRACIEGTPPALGETVAVCGGGNTAMDACRTAVRLGAKTVYVLYRRTRDEMPAAAIEVEEAMQEGVEFRFLATPQEILGENGKVSAVRVQKMELGEADASGRRRPVEIPGAVETLPVTSVIMAIGQKPNLAGLAALDTTRWQTIAADPARFTTNLPGVFAVGDATNNGADIAIAAIGEAQKAAEVIHGFLRGETLAYSKPFVVERAVTGPNAYLQAIPKQAREQNEVVPPAERKTNFAPMLFTLSQEAARREASRCLECGCMDVHECRLLAYARQYDADPTPYQGEKGAYMPDHSLAQFTHDANKCVLCGLCVRVCHEKMGVSALGLAGRGFTTMVSPEFGKNLDSSACVGCGQCVAACPTGALTETIPFQKSVPLHEQTTLATCPGCAALCKLEVRTVGSTVTRAIPGANGIACAQGRFGFAGSNNPALCKTALQNGSPVALAAAYSSLRTVLQAAKGDVAFLLSESLTVEQAEAALRLAATYGKAFTFTPEKSLLAKEKPFDAVALFGDGFTHGANHAYFAAKGLPKAGDLQGFAHVVVLGADAPQALCASPLAVFGFTPGDARFFFPAPQYAQLAGTIQTAAEPLTLRPALSLQTPDLPALCDALLGAAQ